MEEIIEEIEVSLRVNQEHLDSEWCVDAIREYYIGQKYAWIYALRLLKKEGERKKD